jgi:hypothetical protein
MSTGGGQEYGFVWKYVKFIARYCPRRSASKNMKGGLPYEFSYKNVAAWILFIALNGRYLLGTS